MQIELRNISKHFGNSFAIENLSMTIGSGKFTTLLGPSGCGKTTILRMIAGLETPDEGEIYCGGSCVFSASKKINTPPEKRNFGFVFQDFALWPHMRVYENVAFPLKATHRNDNLNYKVKKALKAVRLEEFESRYPEQLSGGQQQRVAFARAIVGEPDCILFDEPLSALDAILRDEMRVEIRRLVTQMGITSVFVTHDQTEAMSMSDTIVVLNKGKIEQSDSPENIYNAPATRFVANFIGKSNWIDNNTMFRPEDLLLEPKEGYISKEAEIIDLQFLGNAYEIHFNGNGQHWTARSPIRLPLGKVSVYIQKEKLKKFNQMAV